MIPGKKDSKACNEVAPLLDDYLHGDLPRGTAERLAVHLEACGACREALDDLRISARLVGAAFEETEEPGAGFARLVMARINTAEQWLQQQRTFWRPFEALALRLAFTAALALAFLFAYGIRLSSETPAPPVASISMQQPDIFTVPVSTVPPNGDEVLMAVAERHHER
jgi:anti-sigma factor RsiW